MGDGGGPKVLKQEKRHTQASFGSSRGEIWVGVTKGNNQAAYLQSEIYYRDSNIEEKLLDEDPYHLKCGLFGL